MTVIENRLGRPLPPETEKVLETMFSSYSQVIVTYEFKSGFSGSCVFLVYPIREDNHSELPSVVKVDDKDRIKQEWDAYQGCIQYRLPSVATISGEPIDPDDCLKGSLRYPLAGDGAFDVLSLYAYYEQASIEDIDYVLKERLFKSLAKIWEQKKFQRAFHLHTAYDSFLHPNLVIETSAEPTQGIPRQIDPSNVRGQKQPFHLEELVQLSGFQVMRILPESRSIILDIPPEQPGAYRLQVRSIPDITVYKVGEAIEALNGCVKQTRYSALQEEVVKIVGSSVDVTADSLPVPNHDALPNPLVALPELLNQPIAVYTACIHADLHLENVLVEPKSRSIHLIDFVNAREDHILRDFLNLELAIVTRLIPGALDKAGFPPKKIISFYERLHCALCYPHQISPPAGLEKPFATLLPLREAAAHHLCHQAEWREYYVGLVFYLLGSLRYNDLNDIPGAKQVAFWAAATSLKLSKTETACAEFLTGPDAATLSSPPDQHKRESEKEEQVTMAHHQDNRSGGVYFEGSGNVKVKGDVIGGNQTKTTFHGPVSGPIHTGSGDINISNRQERAVDRPGFEHLRLDTAIPSKVYNAQPFDIAVAMRQLTAPVLTVDELHRLKPGSLQPSWPSDSSSIQLRVEINAPDCDFSGADSYNFQLYQGQNSPVYYCKLIPRSLGEISLIFSVFQGAFWIGSARISTLVQDKIVGNVQTIVSSYAIEQRNLLHQILVKYFNDSELNNLSFKLGVEYEMLSGRTKQDKARELITFLERRNRVSELIHASYQLRPNAPWWNTLEKI